MAAAERALSTWCGQLALLGRASSPTPLSGRRPKWPVGTQLCPAAWVSPPHPKCTRRTPFQIHWAQLRPHHLRLEALICRQQLWGGSGPGTA